MPKTMFYSTNLKAKEADVKEAILKGLAEDKGLYMPKTIPKFSNSELESFKNKEYWEIASDVMYKYMEGMIPFEELKKICKDAYTFSVPLQKLESDLHIMWLDEGPTAAFKDFAALAMARIMQYFLVKDKKKLLILTATSGDTGSAVANAFYGMNNINVVVLFPEKEITERQRRLMTTLGKNITAISVKGKFDDCQALVKDAFVDKELAYLGLSSANSINIARLIPQAVYYVYAWSRLGKNGKINFSVPSGNFGDLMAGLLAMKMGLPVNKFIVAVNENDEFVNFWNTGRYEKISPSKNCLSNAMNVGHPSNFARLVSLYGGVIDEKGNMQKLPDLGAIRKDMWAFSVSDKNTREEIKSIYDRYKVVIEPHGAVGAYAYEEYIDETNDRNIGVCLETADPAKFPEVIREVLKIEPEMPSQMKKAMEKEENMEKMNNDYFELKRFLVKRFGK